MSEEKAVPKTHKVRKQPEVKQEVKQEVKPAKVQKPELKVDTKSDESVKTRKPNRWLDHVKKYAKDNNISYKDSIVASKTSYTKNS